MQVPPVTSSNDSLRELEVYLAAQLKADKESKHLAPLVIKAGALLQTAGEHHRATAEAMITAMAVRDRVDGEVDDYLRTVFRTAQALHGARGKRIKHLFPDGLTGLIAGPIPEQPGQMRVLAGKLSEGDSGQLSSHADLVVEKACQLDEAVDAHAAAVEQVSIAYAGVLKARTDWIRTYEKIYGELVALHGKQRAERFFKKAKKGKKKGSASSDL